MNLYLKEGDQHKVLEYLETVPAAIEPGWYNSETDKYTAKCAAVPSAVNGWLTALEQYGTMSCQEVLEPVIKLAREGYPVSDTLGLAFLDTYDRILENEAAASVYTNEGLPYMKAQIIVNNQMADTLQKISDGGNQLLETLNILENYDLKGMGHNSYDYLLTMNEAMRLSWRDAYVCLGDPAFFNLPIDKVISKEFAATRMEHMPVDGKSQYIDVQPPAGDLEVSRKDGAAEDSKHTTHISVIDKEGNIVSVTNTLGLSFGCSYLVKGTGFFMNSHVDNMTHDPEKSDSADFVMPGKRVRSTMCPTIVLKDGEPIMAIGSPGSLAIPTAITTILNNVLLFDMGMQEAINAPRGIITTRSKPFSKMTVEGGRIDPEVMKKFVDMGYTMDDKGDYDAALGGIAAIYLEPDTGKFYAGADPRRGYQAYAY